MIIINKVFTERNILSGETVEAHTHTHTHTHTHGEAPAHTSILTIPNLTDTQVDNRD